MKKGTVLALGLLALRGPAPAAAQPARCSSLVVERGSGSFDAAGGAGVLLVAASPDGCPWTASATAPWITFPGGVEGSGTSWLSFLVAPGTVERNGTIVIVTPGTPPPFPPQHGVSQYGPPWGGWMQVPGPGPVTPPVKVVGYALDERVPDGTGVSGVDIHLYDQAAGRLFPFGPATYGIEHPEVAGYHGERFRYSGYEVTIPSLPPGPWGIFAYGRRSDTGELIAAGASNSLQVLAPALEPSASSLHFTAVTSAGAVVAVTGPQALRLAGVGSAAWTASADQPWVTLSASGGVGPGSLVVGVDVSGLTLTPGRTWDATIRLSADGVPGSPREVPVVLRVPSAGATGVPFGSLDTPNESAPALSGAFAVTGWALDDVEVRAVQIYRNCRPDEPQASCQVIDSLSLVYVGDATFVAGARPDVQAAHPRSPMSDRAGWGYMLLTNMLPDGGNGSLALHAYAHDAEGHRTRLGSRSVAVDNESAARPFGTLDRPAPGEVVTGLYAFSGWVLTPIPATIDPGDVRVSIDGQPVGPAVYGQPRPDVAALFPGLRNSEGAGAHFVFDTRSLPNGLHSVAFGAFDNLGGSEGIGSRFFSVQNP